MGMAASQARLLSITARLTNNENTGQAVSYAKQRLADQTQQITNEYNEALDATKLTVLTGFNGAQANYTDISYNLMTGLQMAQETKQYVITDTKGRILVTNDIANAYESSRGNYNAFLAALGNSNDSATGINKKYSQADITLNRSTDKESAGENGLTPTQQKIHEAWDKYFESVGIQVGDPEHQWTGFAFSWTETSEHAIGDGYAGYRRVERNEDGSVHYDPIGYEQKETGRYKQKLDENGNPVFEQLEKEIDGKIEKIFEAEVDSNGKIVETNEPNTGYPAYVQEKNEDGSLKYDADGKPVYKKETTPNKPKLTSTPVYDTEKPVYDITKPIMEDDKSKPIFDYSNPKYIKNGDKYIYDPINYEGTTQESRDLYDYAMALTEAYLRVNDESGKPGYEVEFDIENTAADPNNKSVLQYYRNIFNKIQSNGYFTYTTDPGKASGNKNYIFAGDGTGNKGNVQKSPLKDNFTFEAALRDGSLRLEYYSSTDKKFRTTTISEDNCIQEVADERAIAKAETKYTQDMADLENKDNKLDLELKKLDTEHNALQTEYESVKNVVSKNVETSFKIFS